MNNQNEFLNKRYSKVSVLAFYVSLASSIFAVYISINVWYARNFYEIATPVGYVLDRIHYAWLTGGVVALILGIYSAARKNSRSIWSIFAIILGTITILCFVGVFLYFQYLNATFYKPCPVGNLC